MSATEVHLWRKLRTDFESLARQEYTTIPDPRNDRRLRAYGDYTVATSQAVGSWQLSDGLSADFRARFEETAARAGSALGPPRSVKPVAFWLHRLFLNLVELETLRNDPGSLAVGQKGVGGIIRDICQASATYCSRLMKDATEHEVADQALQHRNQGAHSIAKFPTPSGMNWTDITIRVTSDTRVQIHAGAVSETRTFEEMGFADRRNPAKGPIRAWKTFLELAEKCGEYEIPKFKQMSADTKPSRILGGPHREAELREQKKHREYAVGRQRTALEKRIEEIRERLRHMLGLEGNPLPFIKEDNKFAYRAVFKILCAESYHW